jgi:hypothetical protein
MEREPIEPAVLAVELYREEVNHRKRAWALAGVAITCSLLGALGVLAALRFAPEWFGSTSTTQVAALPKQGPSNVAKSLYTEAPDTPKTPNQKKPEVPNPQKQTEPKKTPDQGNTAPLNPFSGAIISRTPLPEGWKPGDPPPEGSPVNAGDKPPEIKDPPKSSQAILITGRAGGGDPESSAEQIEAALRGAGASIRSAPHYSLAGGVIGVQIIATVPASSAEYVMSRLSSAGVGGADKWSGSTEERAGRVAGMLSSRIRELRAKETELKEKYEEDATEVSVIEEEIQKLNQGLGMVRAAKSGGVAVILIGVGVL